MRTVIYRIYTGPEGKREKHLQGKVFRPKGYDFDIYYRDIFPKRSTLWKTRYEKPESESYNIDHMVLEFLQKHGVQEIHYYIKPKFKLLTVSMKKVDRHIRTGNIKKEMLNNHTQYFIPENLFTWNKRGYAVPWITAQVSINDLLKVKNEEIEQTAVPEAVRYQVYKMWQQEEIRKAQVTHSEQLTLI